MHNCAAESSLQHDCCVAIHAAASSVKVAPGVHASCKHIQLITFAKKAIVMLYNLQTVTTSTFFLSYRFDLNATALNATAMNLAFGTSE